LTSVLTVLLGLIAVTVLLLINPAPALAWIDEPIVADGSAVCGGGWKVKCPGNGTATTCSCTDYDGCTATFADGSTRTAKCSDFANE
jgi:hypothetical protein